MTHACEECLSDLVNGFSVQACNGKFQILDEFGVRWAIRKREDDAFALARQFRRAHQQGALAQQAHGQGEGGTLCGRVFVRHGECALLDKALAEHNRLLQAIEDAIPCSLPEDFRGPDDCEGCKWCNVCRCIVEEQSHAKT